MSVRLPHIVHILFVIHFYYILMRLMATQKSMRQLTGFAINSKYSTWWVNTPHSSRHYFSLSPALCPTGADRRGHLLLRLHRVRHHRHHRRGGRQPQAVAAHLNRALACHRAGRLRHFLGHADPHRWADVVRWTYIHTGIHTHIHHTHMHTHIHTYMYIYIHTYTHVHTYIYTYIHACMNTYTHTYIHAHIHTYMHVHMHAYTHTCMYACVPYVMHSAYLRPD